MGAESAYWLSSTPPVGVPFTLNRASPQAVGLVAWWPAIGNQVGSLRDYATGFHPGTPSSTPGWVGHGELGAMYDFSGSNRFEVANNARLGALTPTLAMWVELDTTSGTQTFVKRDAEWIVRADGSTLAYYQWDAGGLTTLNSITLSTATLYHIVCSWNQDAMKVYVNGFLRHSNSGKTSAPVNIGNIIGIAAQPSGGEALDGRLADVRIYSRALSDAEVFQLYAPQTRWQLYQPSPMAVNDIAVAGGQPMMARGRTVPGMRPVFGGGW